MYVSYLVNQVDKNKEKIQILNCSNTKEKLWKLLQETASKYKEELAAKSEFKSVEVIEDSHNYVITVTGIVVTQIPGYIWNSTEQKQKVLAVLEVKETNDTVHVSKSLDTTLFSELQNKLSERRKVIETDIEH